MVWYLRDLPTHGKGQRGKEVSHLAPLNATQLMTRGQGSRAPGRHRELRRSTSVAQMALLKGESEEGMRTPGYTPESEDRGTSSLLQVYSTRLMQTCAGIL